MEMADILLIVLEAVEILILIIWILIWSRIIIPRRRILEHLDRLEELVDEKNKALELAHRDNEAILEKAIDISKKLRHCYQRTAELQTAVNELRLEKGLPKIEFKQHATDNPAFELLQKSMTPKGTPDLASD